ncbi:uncharacterized protein DS421_10g302370 [Arachis hypogaea]|nr:uncharacterized protein DS421_10g302370 [Arachis hypogaea]
MVGASFTAATLSIAPSTISIVGASFAGHLHPPVWLQESLYSSLSFVLCNNQNHYTLNKPTNPNNNIINLTLTTICNHLFSLVETAEILKWRGKGLESQLDSLEAMIKDLQAEAIFFGQTIAEAAEGLVEIREDYIEDSHKGETKSELEGILMSHPSIEDAAVVPKRDSIRLCFEDVPYCSGRRCCPVTTQTLFCRQSCNSVGKFISLSWCPGLCSNDSICLGKGILYVSKMEVAAQAFPAPEVISDILNGNWDHERTEFSLPPLMTLLLGEPGTGSSSTPSMVGAQAQIKKWIEQASEPNKEVVIKALLGAKEAMLGIRYHMRLMGEAAGVPIEPESQTKLLDATLNFEGVLLAGVPGAGGFDAVFAVTLGDSSSNVTKTWSSLNVLALLVKEDPCGVY